MRNGGLSAIDLGPASVAAHAKHQRRAAASAPELPRRDEHGLRRPAQLLLMPIWWRRPRREPALGSSACSR
jgi:hypothetical protein